MGQASGPYCKHPGGFLDWPGYVMTHALEGLYDREKRQLRIVVLGRDVSPAEMNDACALRAFQGLGPDQPLDSVAYVFIEENAARAHLHEMWLRELEVWTFIRGVETRIDADYTPALSKPEWVRRVEERERT